MFCWFFPLPFPDPSPLCSVPWEADLCEMYQCAPFPSGYQGGSATRQHGQERTNGGVYLLQLPLGAGHPGLPRAHCVGPMHVPEVADSYRPLSRLQALLLSLVQWGQGVVIAPHCHDAWAIAPSFVTLFKPSPYIYNELIFKTLLKIQNLTKPLLSFYNSFPHFNIPVFNNIPGPQKMFNKCLLKMQMYEYRCYQKIFLLSVLDFFICQKSSSHQRFRFPQK